MVHGKKIYQTFFFFFLWLFLSWSLDANLSKIKIITALSGVHTRHNKLTSVPCTLPLFTMRLLLSSSESSVIGRGDFPMHSNLLVSIILLRSSLRATKYGFGPVFSFFCLYLSLLGLWRRGVLNPEFLKN